MSAVRPLRLYNADASLGQPLLKTLLKRLLNADVVAALFDSRSFRGCCSYLKRLLPILLIPGKVATNTRLFDS